MRYPTIGAVCTVGEDLDITSTRLLVFLFLANHENKKTGRCSSKPGEVLASLSTFQHLGLRG
jgi:hypothetical protein